MRLSEALSDFVGGSHRCIRCLLGCKVPSPHHHPSAPRKPRTTSPSIPPPSFTPAQTPVPQKGRPVASQTPRTPCPSLLHHNATPWVPSVVNLQARPPTRDPDTTRRVGFVGADSLDFQVCGPCSTCSVACSNIVMDNQPRSTRGNQ